MSEEQSQIFKFRKGQIVETNERYVHLIKINHEPGSKLERTYLRGEINDIVHVSNENCNSSLVYFVDEVSKEAVKLDEHWLQPYRGSLDLRFREAVRVENYELAAKLRDEINKRGEK